MALGGRRMWNWNDTSGRQSRFVHWDPRQLIHRFGIGRDEHIGITQMKAIQTAQSQAQPNDLIVLADLRGLDVTKLEADVQGLLPKVGSITDSQGPIVSTNKILWCTNDDDNFADVDRPVEMVEVVESLLFSKAAALNFSFLIDFVYLDGPLIWPQGDFIKDLNVVPRERSAGRPFFQAGDQFRVKGQDF